VRDRHNVDSHNESGQTRRLFDVRFGSLADLRTNTSSMSGFGGTADVFELVLRSSPSNCALHKGGRFIPLLLSFQLSFFLWTTLSLFLLFLSAFIFASLIAHIRFSVIENAFSALRYSCLGRVLRGPFRAKSNQRRYVAECLPWVISSRSRV